MATSVLLLTGYIRQIETLLIAQIIPESITALCYKFYYASNLLFYLLNKQTVFYVADIGNKNKWKCQLYPLNHSTQGKSPMQLEINNQGGLHYAHDIKLPQSVSQLIHKAYLQQSTINDINDTLSISNQFDIIFQCGGLNTNRCNAIVIDNTFIQQSSQYGAYHIFLYLHIFIFFYVHNLFSLLCSIPYYNDKLLFVCHIRSNRVQFVFT